MPLSSNVIFETERLCLTEFSPNIVKKIYKLNSDKEVLRYTGDQAFANIKSAIDFLQEYDSYEKHGFGRWSLYTKENDTWTGWCGLLKNTLGHVDLGSRFQS